ncbi:MAG TPA: Spy/CpxP family protein refolding chaperone [Rubrivivax sp.]|nr:Spy/CpxP family protein refolding chaperone [Rubrivivax sp.]
MQAKFNTPRAALAGLAVAAVTAVAAVSVQAMPGGPDGAGPMGAPAAGGHWGGNWGGHWGGHWGGGGMFGGMLGRMLDRVNATPEQRTQIQKIVQASADDMRKQREAGRELRDEAMKLFAQPTVDANAVEALRQKQLAQHDALSKRMTAAMLEISRVLTPEQRKQMSDYMQQRRDMMQRHQRERRSVDTPRS